MHKCCAAAVGLRSVRTILAKDIQGHCYCNQLFVRLIVAGKHFAPLTAVETSGRVPWHTPQSSTTDPTDGCVSTRGRRPDGRAPNRLLIVIACSPDIGKAYATRWETYGRTAAI